MNHRTKGNGAQSLRQVAAILFCLLTVLPLLVFAWTLYRVDAIHSTDAQLGLGLSLAVAVLGFVVLRRLMAQISEVMQTMAMTAAQRGAPAPGGVAGGPALTPGVSSLPAGGSATPPRRPEPSQRPPAPASRPAARATSGLGAIRELDDMRAAVSALWRREAEARVGHDVSVSVANSPEPVVGRLIQVTDDGLLLEQDGNRIGVVWRRITGLERSSAPSAR